MSNRSLFLLLNTARLAFASRRVAAAFSSAVLLLMPLPADIKAVAVPPKITVEKC